MPRPAQTSDILELSLTEHFSGVNLQILPRSGKLIVDLSEWAGGDIEIITADSAELKNPAYPASKNPFQIGDSLQSGPQKGWLIVNFNSNGSIKLLEPRKTAPQAPVTWQEGNKHVENLKAQGHATARLWSKKDGEDIYTNLVEGRHNRKARLNTLAMYWESEESREYRAMAKVKCLDDGSEELHLKTGKAWARCVQDVLEIEL